MQQRFECVKKMQHVLSSLKTIRLEKSTKPKLTDSIKHKHITLFQGSVAWSGEGLGCFKSHRCLHDTGKEINTTLQHMKGVWFCIHWTCLCHWVFELPLSHLSPCSAIYLSFLTQGMGALSPLQICLCRFWMLSLHRAMSALTRVSAVLKCSHPLPSK